MKRIKRNRRKIEKDPSRFFSMKTNEEGASVGNFVDNMKKIYSPVKNVLKKNKSKKY